MLHACFAPLLILLCVSLSLSLSLFHYFTLLSICADGDTPVMLACRCFVALLVCFSYPLQLHPSRMCLTSLAAAAWPSLGLLPPQCVSAGGQPASSVHPAQHYERGGVDDDDNEGEDEDNEDEDENDGGRGGGSSGQDVIHRDEDHQAANKAGTSNGSIISGSNNSSSPSSFSPATAQRFHNGITTLFLLVSTATALAVSDLGVVLAVVGATGSTMISFVLPGFCYVSLFPNSSLKRRFALAQLCAGVVIMPLALGIIIAERATERRR